MSVRIITIARFLLVLVGSLCATQSWSQTSPSAFTWAFRFDGAHRIVGSISPDPDGTGPIHFAASRNTYDSRGLLTRVEYGELSSWQSELVAPANWTGFTIFRQVDFTFDSYGRKLSQQVSSGGQAYTLQQFSYDSQGRLDCSATRMNVAAFSADLSLSACVLGTQGADGPDRIERLTYDTADRLLTVVRAYNTSLQQTYATHTYSGAHLASTRDANGNVTGFTVDGLGRPQYTYFPSPTSPGQTSVSDYEKYDYDADGNQTQLRTRDGNVITYYYDALGRVYSKDVPGTADVSYTFDLRGLQLTALFTDMGLGVTNTFDGFGHPKTTTTTVGGWSRQILYGYDANGNRTRITHPDGMLFGYTHDGLDRIEKICENDEFCQNSANTLVTHTYNAMGRRAQLTRGASVSSTVYGYDNVARLTSLAQDLDGASSTNDNTQTFILNAGSEIKSRTNTNGAYDYSQSLGNRSYSTNGLNQYTQVTTAGSVSLAYDSNGNLTSDGATTFIYDYENRLISATGAKNATLSYDPEGRLFQTSGLSSTQFLYDGTHLIAEYNSNGTLLRRYVHGDGTDETLVWYELGNRRYLHADHEGSVVAFTNSSGSTLEKDTYDLYGVSGTANTSRFQFTGQAWIPELGLSYYKARFYNSALGRFMQVDPIGDADNINLYAYVGNDPLNGIDPTGLQEEGAEISIEIEIEAEVEARELDDFLDQEIHDIDPEFNRAVMSGRPLSRAEYENYLRRVLAEKVEEQRKEDEENSCLSPGALLRKYMSGSGGRWGSAKTRAQNDQIARQWESKPGWKVTRGAGRAQEEWIPGPGGGTKGGTYVDITATNGTSTVRIQTVDTDSTGRPTPREAAAAGRIRSAYPNDQLILVPKSK